MAARRMQTVRVAAECVAAVTGATLVAAALKPVTTAAGLSVVFLLGVLVVSVRRGLVAGLLTAVAGALALNYFFIPPVHRLEVRDSDDVAALVAYLVVAAVTGRLASAAHARQAEAEHRAREAETREAEAEMLAGVAATLLGGQSPAARLPEVSERLARALGLPSARITLASAPDPRPDERAVPLPLGSARGWVHLPRANSVGAPDESKRVLRGLAALFDVAMERERVAARAAKADASRRADVAKTAVLHAISHDLRSPLTAISAAGDALADPALPPPEREELVGVVREEASRLSRLVGDLLDLSRIEAGAVVPRPDWIDLRDVVASAAAQVPGVDVQVALPEQLPLVRADASQLERVFVNLLDNAARFSPPGRPVRVTGGVGGGRVTVRVIDEGPGIPLAERAMIFEPFHKGRRGGGAGLGLAIVRGFVEANGGRILVQAPPGGGTAFAVAFALLPQPAAA